MLTNLFKDEIETVISNLETQVKNNESIKKEDLDNLVLNFNNLRKINNSYGNSKITVEDMKNIEDRINEIASTCDYELNLKVEPSITDRSISMPVEEKESVFKRVKNKINKRVAAWVIIGGIAVSGAIGLASCNKSEAKEAAVTNETTVSDEKSAEEIEKEVKNIVQDMLQKGVVEEITEDNKEVIVEKALIYYFATRINNNTINEKELAEVFGNTTFISEDISNAMHDLNWIDEQRVTVGSSYLDYSLYFTKKADVELLTRASEIINKVKTTSGDEKTAAIAEFKQFVKDSFANTNNRMKYSALALNTFRAVHFDAFDELTEHNEVDDELEHMMNTVVTCVTGENKLEVEDQGIKSQQSVLELYLADKYNKNIESAKLYARQYPERLDTNKSFNKLLANLIKNIDLSNQTVLPNYTEALKELYGLNEPAQISADDSGIKVNGGNLSQSQINELINSGALKPEDAKNPAKIKEAFDKPVTSTENSSGKKVDANAMAQGANDGYTDGNQGLAKNYRSSNADYRSAYDSSYAKGLADKQALDAGLTGPTTTYEPVSNGSKTVTETETEQSYTGVQTNNSVTPGSTFVPVSNGTKTVTESGETVYSYTKNDKDVSTEKYSTQESIELLNSLKAMLNGETNSNAKTR